MGGPHGIEFGSFSNAKMKYTTDRAKTVDVKNGD